MSARSLLAPGPGPVPDGPSGCWVLRRTARLAFPEPAAPATDPVHAARLHRYLTDLLQPYGLAPPPGPPRPPSTAGTAAPHQAAPGPPRVPPPAGQSYGDMAQALIRAVVPAGEEVDLLVLAHSVPDLAPGRATACWLSDVCPGRPLAFAVTDQAGAAAFTALRLLDAYARSAGLRRALLLVVEQDWLPYDPGVPVAVPAVSRGVALLFGDPRPGERTARVSVLAPDPARPGLADPAQPGTGVWWELAGAWAQPSAARGGRLLLPDRDAVLAVEVSG